MLDHNPILWLVQRWRADSSIAWVVGFALLVGCVVNWQTIGPLAPFEPHLALIVCFCLNAGLKIHVADQASLAFARDRGEDTLELLLATPVTPTRLVNGHMLALRQMFRRWIPRMLWVEGVWLAISIAAHAWLGGGDTWLYALAAAALMAFLGPDLDAVAWAALWRGVIARTARDAQWDAMRVLVWPWLLAFVFTRCTFFVQGASRIAAMILWWMLFGALANRWFTEEARRHLEKDLRLWALRRASGELEHYDGWRRFGRWLARCWRQLRLE